METSKPKVLFVLGGPGSGKGTQCEMLVEQFKFEHLSAGDCLRAEVKSGSDLGKEIEGYISKGNMVPGDVTVKLLKKAMEDKGLDKVFIIDGYPRNFSNIEFWEKIMGDTVNVLGVLFLRCSPEIMKQRIMKRGETSGRSDDNEEVFDKRIKVYNDETEPVVKHYEDKSMVFKVSAEGTKEQCFEEIRKVIESLDLDKIAKSNELRKYLKENVDVYLKPLIVHLMKEKHEKVHSAIIQWMNTEGEKIRQRVEKDDA